jgi:hypothetical protein
MFSFSNRRLGHKNDIENYIIYITSEIYLFVYFLHSVFIKGNLHILVSVFQTVFDTLKNTGVLITQQIMSQ